MPSSRSEALAGVSVALLESRMSGEMGDLVRRYGGTPRFVPTVRETPIDCRGPVASFLRTLETAAGLVIVFMTGVGVNVLFDEAERQGQLSFLLEALSHATLVCRGPKPSAALKRRGLTPTLSAREPYTTVELLEVLEHRNLWNRHVVLVHYGERSDLFARALRAWGALLDEMCLYEWQLPEDTRPMMALVEDVVAGRVDTVVFTSQIQGRHLLQVAVETGDSASLIDALNTRTVVAAVGPVCRAALEEAGITPHVVPTNPKMGPLIAALAEHFSALRTPQVANAITKVTK